MQRKSLIYCLTDLIFEFVFAIVLKYTRLNFTMDSTSVISCILKITKPNVEHSLHHLGRREC